MLVKEQGIYIKIKSFLKEKRGYTIKVPKNENVLFLMTGGIDSSLGAELCIRNWNTIIYPLYISRGATAEEYEIESLINIINHLKSKYKDNIKELIMISNNIPPKEIKKKLSRERVIKKGHPLRNTVMQEIAVQCGCSLNDQNIKVNTILLGSVSSDFFSGSREEDILVSMFNICHSLGEWEWQIFSPFLQKGLIDGSDRITKKDLINIGLEIKFPLHLTRTCTSGNKTSCGNCKECKERIKAFKDLKSKDPIRYAKQH